METILPLLPLYQSCKWSLIATAEDNVAVFFLISIICPPLLETASIYVFFSQPSPTVYNKGFPFNLGV